MTYPVPRPSRPTPNLRYIMRPLAHAALCATFATACAGGSPAATTPAPNEKASAEPRYVVDTVATGLQAPWGLAFLPDGRMLVTEKYGGIRLYRNGALDF